MGRENKDYHYLASSTKEISYCSKPWVGSHFGSIWYLVHVFLFNFIHQIVSMKYEENLLLLTWLSSPENRFLTPKPPCFLLQTSCSPVCYIFNEIWDKTIFIYKVYLATSPDRSYSRYACFSTSQLVLCARLQRYVLI